MQNIETPAPAPIDDTYTCDMAPACDMPDGCGAPAGQPCQVGCLSMATDEYDEAFPFDDSDPERDDDEPDRAPSAEQERAWNAQHDGTALGA